MMIGRRPLGVLLAVLFALVLSDSTTLAAQQTVSSRFQVLIPDFQPMNGESDRFGRDLAEELRDQIDDMVTHAAVDRDDIEDALDRFDLDWEDVNCIVARQLAQQNNYQVVLCARYTGTDESWRIQDIRFVDSGTGESFDVDPIMSARRMEEQAAAQIVASFELFVEQTRVGIFCGDYAASQQWDLALQNCDRALELNPNANSSRYTRANVLRQMDRFEESLEETLRLLERDPFHENGLLLGGFLAVNLDDREMARDFYNRYLDLDPTNASVRMTVAYDLAQEGDPLGGMQIIEAGVAIDADNIDFYEQLGNFAFAGAEQVRRETEVSGDEPMTPQVRELYEKAIAAYERVFAEKGAETVVSQLRNVSAAQLQLGNVDEAIAFAERAIESHPMEASLRAIRAEALKEAGRVSEAVAALASIQDIDPDWPNLHLRMGNWLIEAGRVEEAVPVLRQAVAQGASPDQVGNMIFTQAYAAYIQPTQKNYPRFIELIRLAKDFQVSTQARETYDFWHAYSLYSHGIVLQAPETVEAANLTLPIFREALGLFQRGKGYADRTESINFQQFVDATGTYIEIQEAIIARANRR